MQKFHILVLKNGIEYGIEGELERVRDWIERWTKVPCQITVMPTAIPDLTLKDFIPMLWEGKRYTARGLDSIKEKIRKLGIVEKNKYHAVFFVYNAEKFRQEWRTENTLIGAWTYPNVLLGNDVFVEIPLLVEIKDDLTRMATHEFCHVLHRLCWQKGIPTQDSLDLYDGEYDIENPRANRARNILVVKPYLSIISQEPAYYTLIAIYQGVVAVLQGLISLMTTKNRLTEWAEAIKKMEGWFPGSRSQKNNNPGNLKWFGQAGSIGKDNGGFAIFKTYEDGFRALVRQLERAAKGESKFYKADMTLFQFFATYAPSYDSNNPHSYALFIAQQLNISPLTKIKELL